MLCAPGGACFLRVQVPNPPGSNKKDMAEGMGVHREVESERSRMWVSAPLRSVQDKRPPDVLHPREVCAVCSEKSNRYCEITLNAQKSAEAIAAKSLICEDG